MNMSKHTEVTEQYEYMETNFLNFQKSSMYIHSNKKNFLN